MQNTSGRINGQYAFSLMVPSRLCVRWVTEEGELKVRAQERLSIVLI